MNRIERNAFASGEAKLEYLDGEYRVIAPGAFVRCAVTGEAIALENLRYWSCDRQEAYRDPAAVLERRGLSLAPKPR